MLKRNLGVKNAPQRWQDNAADGCFDVVMTFEEKVFDIVIEGQLLSFPCDITNIPVILLMSLGQIAALPNLGNLT